MCDSGNGEPTVWCCSDMAQCCGDGVHVEGLKLLQLPETYVCVCVCGWVVDQGVLGPVTTQWPLLREGLRGQPRPLL